MTQENPQSKNTVSDSTIKAGGDVIIGDLTNAIRLNKNQIAL